jgi:hypothetical protein
MNEEEDLQGHPNPKPRPERKARPRSTPAEPDAPMPSEDGGWASAPPAQAMCTAAVALSTAAVVPGAFFLLWRVRAFVGAAHQGRVRTLFRFPAVHPTP